VAIAVSVVFGIALGLGSLRLLRQATRRIDRAFFRRAYDAAAVLEQLADRLRTSDSREALARLLWTHIGEALAPAELAVFLTDPAGTLRPYEQRWRFPLGPPSADAPWVVRLQKRGRIWDVSARSTEDVPEPVRASSAELLVPILSRDGALNGYILLGSRRSEEPYSGEDRRLLTSVAKQAGIELENIRLAESFAERLDAERAVERELALARQVQHRLFP
jgi:sigma-B regulation protein RsbU (phosphoserine phosphatase)